VSLADNKALSLRANKMWSSGSTDRPEEIFAEGYNNHQESDVEGGVQTRGLARWKQLVDDFHQAFSEATALSTMQIAEADRVATRFEFSAVHTGAFMGAQPTGNRVTWTGVQIDRIDNGKIVESWVDWDKYRFFQGIGLVE
jgi:predicted ester cyclase